MARGTSGRLHFIYSNNRKVSGLTLLELLIAIAVMTVLATAAAPSFSSLIESNKVKRLATEIEWLLVQAKSEAVFRGISVNVQPKTMASTSAAASSLPWSIEASLSDGTVLGKVSSGDFPYIKIYENFSSLNFDKLTGRPKKDGHFGFFVDSSKTVRVEVRKMTGRLVSCSDGGAYGYTQCP
ncbi:prepilin-type N-terminal cleavage/methylation domain-containing protein [Photobacterium sagamiensis]|uniref:pilus assembly FimT family protein n=1 Tax=Photobacterium sagamiensis TaxID=2910241 RepID=UPI003D110A42